MMYVAIPLTSRNNLVDNAINSSKDGGMIKLSATETDSGMEIRVQVFGSGIAKIHHARLFERFYRVDKSRSREHGGTGLGWAIVKHIVQAHGGQIKVESALGKGSCFVISMIGGKPASNKQTI